VNHPAAPLNVLLSQISTMVQFSLIGAIWFEAGLVPVGMVQNKMASCVGTFFAGNMISSSLTKTNAFEIYLNDKLLWSSLKAHRKPNMQDLVNSFNKVGVRIRN